MTRQRDFKRLVRARMAETGERYAAARAMLLAKRQRKTGAAGADQWPGLFDGVARIGGGQSDVAALANALARAGVERPDGEPIDESTLFGLCGGIGFLYGVFEYEGHLPTLTIVPRSRSMPQALLAEGVARLGDGIAQLGTTGGAKTAADWLDEALDTGRPIVCHAEAAGLPYRGASADMAGAEPCAVGVIGSDADDVWLDDRAAVPLRVPRATFESARAIPKKAKFATITITADPEPRRITVPTIAAALQHAARAYDEPPAKPFASNVGRAGLRKWAKLLVERKAARAHARVFGSGREAYVGLRRTYDCIEHDYTAPAASRPAFAGFLRDASQWLESDAIAKVADRVAAAAEHWTAIAGLIVESGDDALREGCELSDRRAELLDTATADTATELADRMRELGERRESLADQCRLEPARVAEIHKAIAEHVEAIADLEERAIDTLRHTADRLRS